MSEGPVVEVLSFPVKPDSQAAFQKVWRHFQHVSGFLGGFWAYQVAGESADGNQTAFAFLKWAAYQDFKNFIGGPAFGPFKEEALTFALSKPNITVIQTDKTLSLAEGDTVEVLTATLNEGSDASTFAREAWGDFRAFLPKLDGYKEHIAGAVLDAPGKYVMVLKWDSTASYQAVRENTDAKTVLAKVKEVATVGVAHTTIGGKFSSAK